MANNLTGEQIQNTLDLFLYKALEPVILRTELFDDQVRYILSASAKNRKRKLTAMDREKSIAMLSQFLYTEDREEKFKIIRKARIERSMIYIFLERLLDKNSGFLNLYSIFLESKGQKKYAKKLNSVADRYTCKKQDLFVICNTVPDFLKKFYEYRGLVVGNYIKHSSNQTRAYISKNPSLKIDFQDARQSMLKAILIAIDKYDSSQGAITTYINWWLLNARTSSTSEHEYGIAYTIPQAHRKKIANKDSTDINFSVSLDSLKDEDDEKGLHDFLTDDKILDEGIEDNENEKIVQYLSKSVDVKGCARLSLDIGEVFSRAEYKIMLDHMKEEGLGTDLLDVNKIIRSQ